MNEEVVTDWKARLASITEGYDPRDIWNMDETGLVYRALPDKTLTVRGEQCTGGKRSKERLTLVLACNMLGDFDRVLVIGKAAKPHAFRNLNVNTQLPVTWRFNKKAWMTSQLFTEWLTSFNSKMRLQKRQVLLFLDNAPSHPHNLPNFSNVKLVFFPANTTSALQPLDQGIIQNVKVLYRKRLLQKVLDDIDTGLTASELVKSVNVLNVITWVHSAVKSVKPQTVTKCFVKSGFSTPTQHSTQDSEDDENDDIPLARLIDQFRQARDLPEPITDPLEYASIDSDIPSSETLTEGWEQRLVDDFVPDRQPDSSHDTNSDS